MTVTNKTFKNKAMQIYGTKTARFDTSSENPLPEIFGDRESYDVWTQTMYDFITGQYGKAREISRVKGPKGGLSTLMEIIDNLTQIREQLGDHYQGFKEGLRTYAEQALGKIKASDLMETIRLYEGEEELNQKEGEVRGSPTSKLEQFVGVYQTPGFKPGESGYADEGRLKTDYGEKAEERLNDFFSGD